MREDRNPDVTAPIKEITEIGAEDHSGQKSEELHVIEDVTYQLIRSKLVKDNGIKIEDKDIEDFAKQVAKAQFAQYGMLSVPEDALANYAQNMLKDKQTQQRIADRAIEDKLAEWLKTQVSLEVKEVSAEEFNKLFEA